MDNGLKTNKSGRWGVIDALRGGAILAILLIHCSNNFVWGLTVPLAERVYCLGAVDEWVRRVLYGLFEGKAYAVFALLFGFTYGLLIERRGITALGMTRRMVWLGVFGVLNGVFFCGGDPLLFYALVMMLVIPLRGLSTKAMTILAIVFLIFPAVSLPQWQNDSYNWMFEVQGEGEFFSTLWAGGVYGMNGALLWGVSTWRVVQTVGLFLLGIVAYRHRELIFGATKLQLIRTFLVFLLGGVGLSLGSVFSMTGNVALSFAWIILFVLLYRFLPRTMFAVWLESYGRMSLTNFIGQSVICSFLFYPWGLNLTAYLGTAYSVLCGVVVFFVQVWWSRWWLRTHSKGPLESLWNRLSR